jgi:hypothetical protein
MAEQNTTKEKDFWDKADVIVKGAAAVLVSGAIAFYGIYSEDKRSKEADNQRRAQVIIQTLANREATAADLRSKMFGTLMQYYLQGKDKKSQIMYLELIALNFQDEFRLRPLIENLDATLTANSKDKRELRRVARSIAKRDIDSLVGSGGNVCELDLAINKQKQAECAPVLLKLLDVQEDRIRVTSGNTEPFEVSYFDMPFTDNSKKGELTYSLVLSDTKKKDGRAKVSVVVFPRHYYSGANRLGFDQMIGEYLIKDNPK